MKLTNFRRFHGDFKIITHPGVDTVGEGLLDLISSLVAFLIGNVVGVLKMSSGGFWGSNFWGSNFTGFSEILGVIRIGFFAAPIFSRLSSGGGLDFVGFGRTFDLLGSSFRPPPIGLFKRVPNADSLSNSHLIMVSLTEINASYSVNLCTLKIQNKPHRVQNILRHFYYTTMQKLCKFEAM